MFRRIACPIAILLLSAACTPVKTVKLPPPFQSSPDEEKSVDRLLARWEQWNAGVKSFDCRIKRWTYDTVFGRADQPKYVDLGTLHYAAPDHLLFHIAKTEKDGKTYPIDDTRAEHWVFDGTSIVECNQMKRQIIEHKLPAEFQGTKLVDGPLTFGFPTGVFAAMLGSAPCPYPLGAKAKELKEQFYIRQIAPPAARHDEIWLEAYPRSSTLAAAFQKLDLIFRASDMSPLAMKIMQPNGKDSVVYGFFNIAVNSPPTPDDDPFHPTVPAGWRKTVEESPASTGSAAVLLRP